jgi:hypothetical protein
MRSHIDNYLGEWEDESGKSLRITKLNGTTASVSLLSHGQAIARPWCQGKPSINMLGVYSETEGAELLVVLWEMGKGFTLHLSFEPDFMLDKFHRDSLTIGLSRYEEDHFLDAYTPLFAPLKHYAKSSGNPDIAHDPARTKA